MSFSREVDTEHVVHLHNGILLTYSTQWIHEILRQMDGNETYHSEWENPIIKEHTWYALTDKWILTQKLRRLKIQFTDHTNLKNEHHSVDAWDCKKVVKKYSWKQIWSLQQRVKERPSIYCPIWESFPCIVTKPRHYCGWQEVHADRRCLLSGSAWAWHTNADTDS